MSGAEMIAAERQRQIDTEGWTPEHDAGHTRGELAHAACWYAMPDGYIRSVLWWPWDGDPKRHTVDERVDELAKAGALIAAEIDRLQRGADR